MSSQFPISRESYDQFIEDLRAHTPDTWDDDASAEGILTDFVEHVVGEVKRLGGCLNKWCRWADDEPCDHGYLSTEDALAAFENRPEAEYRMLVKGWKNDGYSNGRPRDFVSDHYHPHPGSVAMERARVGAYVKDDWQPHITEVVVEKRTVTPWAVTDDLG